MKKKIFIIASALYIASFNALAYTLSYSYNGSAMTASVEDYSGGAEDVIIPSKVSRRVNTGKKDDDGDYIYVTKTYAVTSIGYSAFRNCGLTSIVIPDSVTSIDDSAFFRCSNLEKVDGLDKLTSIPSSLFYECSNLTTIDIDFSKIISIGSSAFYGCDKLNFSEDGVLNLPNIESIGNNAYSRCDGLKKVITGEKLVTLKDGAFYYCRGLVEAEINGTNLHISFGVFRCCSNLNVLKFGDGVVSISGSIFPLSGREYMFAGCSNLQYVHFGDGITSIPKDLFYKCSSLKSVTGFSNLKSIGTCAFYGCSNLEKVDGLDKLTSIPYRLFNGCSNLTTIDIDFSKIISIDYSAFEECYKLNFSEDGVLNLPNIESIGSYVFYYCYGLKKVIPGEKLVTLGVGVFYGCSGLTSVTIPDSVTSIGYAAFKGCNNLTSITIPDSVTSIDSFTFEGCSSLPSVIIPDSVTRIGESAFRYCSGLTSITIGNSVTSIVKSAFYRCSSLSDVYFMGIPPEVEGGAFSRIATGARGHYRKGYQSSWLPKIDSNGKWNGLIMDEIDPLVYSYNDATMEATVIGYSGGAEPVIIPTTVTVERFGYGERTYKVTSIGADAFKRSSITSIEIPDSITSIGENAFQDCIGLKKVYITNINAWCSILFHNADSNPLCNGGDLYEIGFLGGVYLVDDLETDGTTSINDFAFYGCNSLKRLSVGFSSIKLSIGKEAFRFCPNLKSAILPNNVTHIRIRAFADCLQLSEVYINNSSTSVDILVCDGCESIKKVMVCQSICDKRMKDFFPLSYKSIESVSIAYGVTSIGDEAFRDCSGFTSITIPDSVTSIGDGAFWGCSGLTDIEIPDSVTSIGKEAFAGCISLKKAVIGSGVKNIGVAAFGFCKELKSIWVSSNNSYYKSDYYSSMLLSKNGKTLIEGVNGRVLVPDTVTTIGESAFIGRCKLTHIMLHDKVEKIGDYAFCCCENLGSFYKFDIPPSVEIIGNYAFKGCRGLTSITIPYSVESIGYEAFRGCSGLKSVTICEGVTSIGGYAFYKCSNLTNVFFWGDAPKMEMGSNIFEDCHEDLKIEFYQNADGWDKYLDSTVSSSIFGANYSLGKASVNVEEGPIIMTEMVDGIEWKYFVNAGKTEIYGGNGWTSAISSNTMGSITIPSQLSDCPVISIHNSAFLDCAGLTNITIPNSVTNIGFAAFSGCSGLTSVTIPDSVTSIDDYAFPGCSSLTSVTIPDSVTSIGEHAFYNCSGLTSITIPNSVTSIGDNAFYNCSGLTSITIPDGVTHIGSSAFYQCVNLKLAIFLGDAPGNVGNDIFSNCADDFTIKVKNGTKGWNGDYTSTELPETWLGYPIEYATVDDLYPVLDANATVEDVANALGGSVDTNLAKNITSVEMYSKYKEWAISVKSPSGEGVAGVEAVMDSSIAWMSFALDQSRLIANEPVEGDVSIASLDLVETDGAFEFTVNINQIDVGDGAVEENLKKLFKIEGTATLGSDENFSSENVEIKLAEPVNGNVKFKILPKDSPDSFFIRATLLK